DGVTRGVWRSEVQQEAPASFDLRHTIRRDEPGEDSGGVGASPRAERGAPGASPHSNPRGNAPAASPRSVASDGRAVERVGASERLGVSPRSEGRLGVSPRSEGRVGEGSPRGRASERLGEVLHDGRRGMPQEVGYRDTLSSASTAGTSQEPGLSEQERERRELRERRFAQSSALAMATIGPQA
ncbi:hypothetical protein T484DRAFT_1766920, partial [Baffinella frigidus]